MRTSMISGLTVFMLLTFLSVLPTGAEELTAIQIYDGMIHYESDQLSRVAGINDYHCKITESTTRTSVTSREVIDKEYYFMVPTFQMELIDDQVPFYFDDTLMIHFLENFELTRERNMEIDGIACYAFRSTAMDPAFSRYYRIFYVAQDDFRHVRTNGIVATREYDNLSLVMNYTYAPAGQFVLLSEKKAEYSDEEGNMIASVTASYTDYEFDLNLNVEFFANFVGTNDPIPPWN